MPRRHRRGDPELVHGRLDDHGIRAGADGHRNRPLAAQCDQIHRPWHGYAFVFDELGHPGRHRPLDLDRSHPFPRCPIPPVADGIVDAKAHGLADVELGQLEPNSSEDLDFGSAPERLGVDQEAIEVEHHRPHRPSGGGIRRREAGRRGRGVRCDDQARFLTMSTIASPAAVGLRATVTPASARASILACAVPLDPEMMAPAWPILRPGGAVTPAT